RAHLAPNDHGREPSVVLAVEDNKPPIRPTVCGAAAAARGSPFVVDRLPPRNRPLGTIGHEQQCPSPPPAAMSVAQVPSMQTSKEFQRCAGCGFDRVSSIEIRCESELLVCSACLECGRTSWSHDGEPSSTDDVLPTVERFWQVPTPRRPRRRANQPRAAVY